MSEALRTNVIESSSSLQAVQLRVALQPDKPQLRVKFRAAEQDVRNGDGLEDVVAKRADRLNTPWPVGLPGINVGKRTAVRLPDRLGGVEEGDVDDAGSVAPVRQRRESSDGDRP